MRHRSPASCDVAIDRPGEIDGSFSGVTVFLREQMSAGRFGAKPVVETVIAQLEMQPERELEALAFHGRVLEAGSLPLSLPEKRSLLSYQLRPRGVHDRKLRALSAPGSWIEGREEKPPVVEKSGYTVPFSARPQTS